MHTNDRRLLAPAAHSPDNSFLGFVVGEFKRNATASPKKDIAVVYGKEYYMWKVRGQGGEMIFKAFSHS